MTQHFIKLFLRISISFGFLSAVADRLGLWPEKVSAWYNWDSFISYTKLINPWFTDEIAIVIGTIATIFEVVFALTLLIGFKTELFAKLSAYLLLCFALAMTFSIGIKSTLDYSVFIASAAAFSLSIMKDKFFELDLLLTKNK